MEAHYGDLRFGSQHSFSLVKPDATTQTNNFNRKSRSEIHKDGYKDGGSLRGRGKLWATQRMKYRESTLLSSQKSVKDKDKEKEKDKDKEKEKEKELRLFKSTSKKDERNSITSNNFFVDSGVEGFRDGERDSFSSPSLSAETDSCELIITQVLQV